MPGAYHRKLGVNNLPGKGLLLFLFHPIPPPLLLLAKGERICKNRGKDFLLPRSDCQKSLAEFAASAANKIKIIFCRGVYLAENTLQAASVEFVYKKGDPIKRKRALWGEEITGHRWHFLLAGNGALCLDYRRYARSRLQETGGKARKGFFDKLNRHHPSRMAAINIFRDIGI